MCHDHATTLFLSISEEGAPSEWHCPNCSAQLIQEVGTLNFVRKPGGVSQPLGTVSYPERSTSVVRSKPFIDFHPENIEDGSNEPPKLPCPDCGNAHGSPHFAHCSRHPNSIANLPKKGQIAYQAEGHPAQVEVVPGALSTPCLDYSLIPPLVWEELARRFMLGEERKGSKAWNANSSNQHILLSRKFILNRISHAIQHLLNLQRKLNASEDLSQTESDPGAILWAGAFLACAREALINESRKSKEA